MDGEQDQLEAAKQAFAATDFGSARRLLLLLHRSAQDPAVREEADQWLDRLRPDPVVIGICAACLLLFAAIVSVNIH